MMREILDPGLCFQPCGYIQKHPYVIHHIAFFIQYLADWQQFRKQLAIFAPVNQLTFPVTLLFYRLPHGPVKGLILLAGGEYFWILIPDILQGITGDPGKSRIDRDNALICISYHDPAGAGIQHGTCQLHSVFIFPAFR